MKVKAVVVAPFVVALLAGAAHGAGGKGEPEYTRMKLRVGMVVEVKGHLNPDGPFVAEDATPLEGAARKPRLRAPIEAIDQKAGTIRVLGMTIQVRDDTEFDSGAFADLRTGQQVEVKCSVRADGWKAASIETLDVKPGIKVKATITRVASDGHPPDTLDASGFLILLTEETDVNEESRRPSSRERRLFRELAHDDAGSTDRGVRFADGRGYFAAEYRHLYEDESERDLSPSFDSDTEDMEPQLRAMVVGYPHPRVRGLGQLRARQRVVIDAPAGDSSGDIEVDVLQLSVLARDIGGAPVALQVGRQRLKEPREWLYDEYLDAARVSVYPWRRFSFEGSYVDGTNSLKDKFRSWTDAIAVANTGLGDGLVSAYLWRRWDSDEQRNREPFWAGLRYRGRIVDWLSGWGEAALMRGEDKHRDLDAWAFDAGVTASADAVQLRPSASVGYAFGSGNPPDGDGKDRRFRQTSYEDNSSRMNGVGLVRYYGALMDPELSNIAIFTAGAGVRPLPYASIEALYHRYSQHHPDDRLRGDLIDPPARPNGVDPELGSALDVVIGVSELAGHVTASWTLAWFFPGAAFAPRDETAFLNRIEIRLEL